MARGKRIAVLLWVVLLWPLGVQAVGIIVPYATYLTWQRDPTTTMTVQWISGLEDTNDDVYYCREGGSSWTIALGSHQPMPENEPYLIHKSELHGLTPGASYIFKTGDWAAPNRKFRTMPKDMGEAIRFVVGGDMYHSKLDFLIETNRQAAKTDPHFALVGGDIAYAAGKSPGKSPPEKKKRWLAWLMAWSQYMVTPEGYLIPMVPAIGNHDVNGGYGQSPDQAKFFYALFAFPGMQGYNVLDFGQYMSVVVLDSAHTHPIPGGQTLWLYRTLEERAARPYKFALYHVPAYPCVRKFEEGHSRQVREFWVPIFDYFGLTAAFENHDHAYKRTYPISRGHIDPSGVLYLGDGGWAVKRPRKPNKAGSVWYLAKTVSARNFVLVTLQGSARSYTAFDSKGNVIDTYSLQPKPALR